MKKYFGIISGIIVFISYLFTVSPSIVGGDAGELAAVQATLGIAHPSGYPLFTLIGHLFYLLPLPFTPIFKFNLLAALYCSLSVVFMAYIIKMVLENLDKKAAAGNIFSGNNQTANFLRSGGIILISFIGSFIWAFSFLVWFQSTSTEVYSLHIFLLNAIIYFALKSYYSEPLGKKEFKQWLLASIFLALGFSNHLTTIFIIPGLIFLLYKKYGFTRLSLKVLLQSALIILMGAALFYSYLIIRSNQEPFLNWGDPSNLSSLIYHITARQYHGAFSFDLNTGLIKLEYLFKTLFDTNYWEFHFGILFSFAGAVILFLTNRTLLVFISICIVVTTIISINYNIPDINSYFFLIYICLAILSAAGIYSLSIIFSSKTAKILVIVIAGGTVLFFQIDQHSNKVNRHSYYIYEDYTKQVLNSVEENAVIIINQWAPFFFPSFYYQLVEEYRTDVTVVCINSDFKWYKNSIYKISPDVVDIKNSKFNFKLSSRPVYVYYPLVTKLKLPSGYYYKPDLFLFKVENDEEYMELKSYDVAIRTENLIRDHQFVSLEKNICNMLEHRILYESVFNEKTNATELLEIIKSRFPDYNFTVNWQNVLLNMDSHKIN